MFSRTADYAVRATLWLAHTPQVTKTASQVATATGVPPGYMMKVLNALVRRGVIRSQPGPGGGFTLNGDPTEIALYDVMEAVDPLPRIRTCPINNPAHGTSLCPLHARLDAALAHMEQEFRDCSLAEILAESETPAILCEHITAGAPAVAAVPTACANGNGACKNGKEKCEGHGQSARTTVMI